MNQSNHPLSGKVAWVTGGSSGIGQHCAIGLARAGARVIISGRRIESINATIAATTATTTATNTADHPSLDISGMAVDVSDKAAVQDVATAIADKYGAIDILVNSAGINVPNRSWATLDAEVFDRVVAINLNGSMYCMLAVLPGMRAKKNGLIINVASWAGRYVSGLTGPAYTGAKHALVATAQSLNMEECVNGIRASTILPGEVATPIMQSRAVPPSPEELAKMLQPEQVAQAVLFVAQMPSSVCVNEILISPTWNRSYPSVQAMSR